MCRTLILASVLWIAICKAQVKKVGLSYTHIPRSSIYMNDQLHVINGTYLHAFVRPFIAGVSLSWGGNSVKYQYHHVFDFRNKSIKPYSRELISRFRSQQVALGLLIYHRLVDRKTIRFLPGIAASTSFFTKSAANFSTIQLDYYDTQTPNDSIPIFSVTPDSRNDHNYNNLCNPQPDLFLLNLLSRVELKLATRIDFVIEPFLTITQINKHNIRPFGALGLTVGATWLLPTPKTKQRS